MVVTPDTSKKYTEGTAQNIRRSADEKDLLIADLIIYDKELIKKIEEGKREISCGYECDYVLVDGTYCQTNIRGNHIAVVDAGRAGHRVRIKDSEIKNKRIKNNINSKGDKNSMSKKLKNLTRKKRPVNDFLVAVGLKHVATDAEPEDLADVVDALQEENSTSCDEETTQDEENKPAPAPQNNEGEENKGANDTDPIAALTAQVQQLTQLVSGLVQNKEKTSDEVIDDMINELGGETTQDEDQIDEEESVTVPVENIDSDDPEETSDEDEENESAPTVSNDAAVKIAALNAIKPVIAQIKDPVQRKKACDSLRKQFMATKPKRKNNVDGYGNIMNSKRKAAEKHKKKFNDARTQTNVQEIGDNIYSKYNANAPKGGNQ